MYLDDDAKEATVVVPDDQLALAIGKEGMNARLAARLTGWKIDIQSDSEFAQAEADVAFGGGGDEQDLSGRCGAILANGKRCPNAALPGSRWCGVAAHQALALADVPDDEEPIVPEDEPELEDIIAPPEAESFGLESLPEPEIGEVESEAPADAAATHGPSATAIAAAEDAVDLDTVTHEVAPLEEIPAGIPVEQEGADEA